MTKKNLILGLSVLFFTAFTAYSMHVKQERMKEMNTSSLSMVTLEQIASWAQAGGEGGGESSGCPCEPPYECILGKCYENSNDTNNGLISTGTCPGDSTKFWRSCSAPGSGCSQSDC